MSVDFICMVYLYESQHSLILDWLDEDIIISDVWSFLKTEGKKKKNEN